MKSNHGDIEAEVTSLAEDFTTPPSMFAAESELTYYADGTRVIVRGSSKDGRTGTTIGVKHAFPYPFQAVRWDDGDSSCIAPHPLRRIEVAA